MKLNQLIRFQEELNGYRMDMLNGTVMVPKIPGAYNIATGCGSGKTAIIKQVIEQKYESGIIVFCRTIEECNNLYDFTIQNVVPSSYGNLNISDIANLCSEPRYEEINGRKICTNGVNNEWKNNLNLLASKKVIIATHSVLMNTPLDKLMIINCTKKSKSELHIFQKAFGLTNNIRQFMIIDEVMDELNLWILDNILLIKSMNINTYIFTDKVSIKDYNEDRIKAENDFITNQKNKMFKLDEIDNILYPDKFRKMFSNEGKSMCSRRYRLSNRSVQEKLMDLLVQINYFGVKIVREVPFIHKNGSSYYLADYYVPECNLIIELDSDYHDEDKDQLRDLYFEGLGIKVMRLRDFTASEDEIRLIKDNIDNNKSSYSSYEFYDWSEFNYSLNKANTLTYYKTNDEITKILIKTCRSENDMRIKFDPSIPDNNVGYLEI